MISYTSGKRNSEKGFYVSLKRKSFMFKETEIPMDLFVSMDVFE